MQRYSWESRTLSSTPFSTFNDVLIGKRPEWESLGVINAPAMMEKEYQNSYIIISGTPNRID
jgi:hypothetical protein